MTSPTASAQPDDGQTPAASAVEGFTRRADAGAEPSRGERAEVSTRVVGIWRSILNAEQVAADDNFFALGGTSLSALRVVLEIHREFGVEVPLGVVFKSPTVATLVDAVVQLRSAIAPEDERPSTPPVERPSAIDDVRRVPASLIQEASLVIAASDTDGGHLSWVYQLNGRLDVAAFAKAVDDVVLRHDILRTRFERLEGRWYQVVTPFTPQVLTIVDLGGQPKLAGLNAAVEKIEATYRTLSPLVDPRFQAFLYTIDPKTSVLAMFLAEAVVDSDAGPLVAAEITRAYAARTGHAEPPSLPLPIGTSYLDYVATHRVDSSILQRARDYWKHQSRSAPSMSCWPMAQSGSPSTCAFQLTPEEWAKLMRSIQSMGTTAYVFILASFQIALARLVDLAHLLVDSTVSDRSDPVTERMIGNFQSPVRVEVRVLPTDRFTDVISRSSAAVCEAVTHCAVPPVLTDVPGMSPDIAPIPAVRFHMFDHHEGPVFAGIRRRRFRLHSVSRAPLRLNCIRGPNGRQDFVFFSATASQDLVSNLARAVRSVLEAAVVDPSIPVGAIDIASSQPCSAPAATDAAPP